MLGSFGVSDKAREEEEKSRREGEEKEEGGRRDHQACFCVEVDREAVVAPVLLVAVRW